VLKDRKTATRSRRQAAESIGLLEAKARGQSSLPFQGEEKPLISDSSMRRILLTV